MRIIKSLTLYVLVHGSEILIARAVQIKLLKLVIKIRFQTFHCSS
jgi:hypothetical protein